MQGTSPAGMQGERCLGDSVKGPLVFPSFPKRCGDYALGTHFEKALREEANAEMDKYLSA